MIELRWRRLQNTRDCLQWRELLDHSQGEYELKGWTDVPVFIDEKTDNENKL